ncbi:MAG TPA: DUF3089 domain-containing protein [Vitreimonas sp.]|nr:DUF3089 domain-containing protein [Vitreimonas sp.]
MPHANATSLTLAAIAALFLSAFGAESCAQTPVSAPPAPDYSQTAAWAALPGQASDANDVPQGLPSPHTGDVAVFFIHPTTDLSMTISNAAYDEGGRAGEFVDHWVLKLQASVFNGCCEIYAPRYRQASLRAIITNSLEAYAAADLAYSDVARAFDAFLSRIGDRPFIIASHSQGSIHALRLLQERAIGTPLQRRLVAAYPIGLALPKAIADLGLPVCDSATQINCVVTWNSVQSGHDDPRRRNSAVIWWDGHYQPIGGRPLVCVNPLTWQPDTIAPADANLGSVYAAGVNAPIPAPEPHVTGAACENSLLGVDIRPDQAAHFHDALSATGIYHDFDYGLFYVNLRQNIAARIAAYEHLR